MSSPQGRVAELEQQVETYRLALQRAQEQALSLDVLHESMLGLVSRLDLNALLAEVVRRSCVLIGTPHGFIYLLPPGKEEMERQVGVGIYDTDRVHHLKRGEGFSGAIWQTGKPLIVNDYDAWPGRSRAVAGLADSMLGVPLWVQQEVAGVLALASEKGSGREFNEEELALLNRFAQIASLALENARLFSDAQEARIVAESANQMKSDFLSNISHELRTPLTSIIGFAKIIQADLGARIFPAVHSDERAVRRAQSQVGESLEIIISEGERLTRLINNLLDLAKIEAGKMEWKHVQVNLAEVVDRSAVATASLFEQKGLEMVCDVEPGLPEICADPDRLIQVVINLISNAVKFTPQGRVTIQARGLESDVQVSVTDQGIGIALEDQQRLFEKFTQIGDSLTGKPKGTGLGLAISKEIIEHHGGRIWVESQPGKGSTFIFTLPIPTPG